MQPLSIFVSSTCYDLKALREHLRSEITDWGHDPVLSEYPSFPVSPELSTVENCKKVVRDRADVFVLVVGGRRGSLDPTSQRSVVNVEYREAKAAGLDCIVFIDRHVWELLPHHQRNPDADFTASVDYPDVFRFIADISKDTKWIFPFTRTDELLTVLKTQLSIRFRDLLVRARTNKLTIPTEFVGEPPHISRIVLDRDSLWEYRLTSELLKNRMSRLDAKFTDLNSGFAVRRTKYLAGRDTLNHIQNLLNDLTNIVEAAVKILPEQLTPAFGPPGVPGDAAQIKRACDNLYALFLSLYEWELDVRFVRPHEAFGNLFQKMYGWTNELLSEFRRIPNELDQLLSQPDLKGEYTIHLVIKAPAGLEVLTAEFRKMTNDPRIIEAIANGG